MQLKYTATAEYTIVVYSSLHSSSLTLCKSDRERVSHICNFVCVAYYNARRAYISHAIVIAHFLVCHVLWQAQRAHARVTEIAADN